MTRIRGELREEAVLCGEGNPLVLHGLLQILDQRVHVCAADTESLRLILRRSTSTVSKYRSSRRAGVSTSERG